MNSLIEAIGNRISFPKLQDPAPDNDTLDKLFEACLRVPDHLQLRPWRFLLIQGEQRKKLGQLFAESEAKKNPDANEEALKAKAMKAMRAPLIIVGICCHQENPKVPEIEEQLSTGCVLHNLGLALRSIGYASVWRTGKFAYDQEIKQGLDLKANESIVGYLYVGTPAGKEHTLKPLELSKHISQWS